MSKPAGVAQTSGETFRDFTRTWGQFWRRDWFLVFCIFLSTLKLLEDPAWYAQGIGILLWIALLFRIIEFRTEKNKVPIWTSWGRWLLVFAVICYSILELLKDPAWYAWGMSALLWIVLLFRIIELLTGKDKMPVWVGWGILFAGICLLFVYPGTLSP